MRWMFVYGCWSTIIICNRDQIGPTYTYMLVYTNMKTETLAHLPKIRNSLFKYKRATEILRETLNATISVYSMGCLFLLFFIPFFSLFIFCCASVLFRFSSLSLFFLLNKDVCVGGKHVRQFKIYSSYVKHINLMA